MSGLFTGKDPNESDYDFDNDAIADDNDVDIIEEAPQYERESGQAYEPATPYAQPVRPAMAKKTSVGVIAAWVAVGLILAVVIVYIAAFVASSKSVNGINNATSKLYTVAIDSSDQIAETARTSPDDTTKEAAQGVHQIIRTMAGQEQGRVSSTTSSDDAARILGLPLGMCAVAENIQNVANQGTADVINECTEYSEAISHYGNIANISSTLPFVNAPSVLE